jgi:hypothetical protein
MTKKTTAKERRKRQREQMIRELSDRLWRDLAYGRNSDDEIMSARKQLSAADIRAAVKIAREKFESPLTSVYFKRLPGGALIQW